MRGREQGRIGGQPPFLRPGTPKFRAMTALRSEAIVLEPIPARSLSGLTGCSPDIESAIAGVRFNLREFRGCKGAVP